MQSISDRTKSFALRVIKLYSSLPKTTLAQILGKQLVRSGTSVGAHYREGKRARSNAEFVSKIEVGLQELEESVYWIELLVESNIVENKLVHNLLKEADELISIHVTMINNAKK
ncbi:MAG: four helix bundle protein [Parachlamydiaceae bacterium]